MGDYKLSAQLIGHEADVSAARSTLRIQANRIRSVPFLFPHLISFSLHQETVASELGAALNPPLPLSKGFS